jgi:hypothetical protein
MRAGGAIMDVDFVEAARRHYSDAEHLYAERRLPNAGQLYGFTAECGLKGILIHYGLPYDPLSGDLIGPPHTNPYMKHIDGLVATVSTYPAADRAFFSLLALMPDISDFSDWSVNQRYWGDAKVAGRQDKWKKAAGQVMSALQSVDLDDAGRE